MIKKPNLFIVGAAKSGTTTLQTLLNRHSQIFMSPIKEPNFFSKDIETENFRNDYKKTSFLDEKEYFKKNRLEERHIAFIKKQENYLSLFKEVESELYLGEASTSYLYSRIAAKEIYNFNPNSKIIIMLRHPIDRVISHYYMDVAAGRQKEKNVLKGIKADFEKNRKGWGVSNLYIELSNYKTQIANYLKYFPKNQVLIIDFEEFKTNQVSVMRKIQLFLGINSFEEIVGEEKRNETLVPKIGIFHYVMKIKVKFFHDFKNEKLKTFIKRIFFKKPSYDLSEDCREYLHHLLSDDINYYQSISLEKN